MSPQINPRTVKTWSEIFWDGSRGDKYFRAGFQLGHFAQYSRKKFGTAGEAQDYATRAIVLWTRLYDLQVKVTV